MMNLKPDWWWLMMFLMFAGISSREIEKSSFMGQGMLGRLLPNIKRIQLRGCRNYGHLWVQLNFVFLGHTSSYIHNHLKPASIIPVLSFDRTLPNTWPVRIPVNGCKWILQRLNLEVTNLRSSCVQSKGFEQIRLGLAGFYRFLNTSMGQHQKIPGQFYHLIVVCSVDLVVYCDEDILKLARSFMFSPWGACKFLGGNNYAHSFSTFQKSKLRYNSYYSLHNCWTILVSTFSTFSSAKSSNKSQFQMQKALLWAEGLLPMRLECPEVLGSCDLQRVFGHDGHNSMEILTIFHSKSMSS